MRVRIVPADKGGCAFYRCQLPMRALGGEMSIQEHIKLMPVFEETPDGPKQVGVVKPDTDVVVLGRPIQKWRVELIEYLQAHGVAVVVEIDDDMKTISPYNAAWGALQPHLNPDQNWQWMEKAARLADWVTVTTPALAERYGKHGRVSIVPNYVPTEYLEVERLFPNERLTVGWAGFVESHPRDLGVLKGITSVLKKHDAVFAQIGCGKAQELLGIPDSHFLHIANVPLEDYAQALTQFDIGVAPLENTPFNQAKSWLKPLEYMAVGVPWVGSNTEPYTELQALSGVGATAKKFSAWARHLDELLSDDKLRNEWATTGREVVAETLTVAANKHKWKTAWESALEHRQKFPVTAQNWNPLNLERVTVR